MTLKNRKQNLRKVYDTLYHFDNYISILEKDSSIVPSNKKCLTKYLIEILIYKANSLEKEDLDQYIKELKKRKIYRLLPNDTKKDKLGDYDVVLHISKEKSEKVYSQIINGQKCVVIPLEEDEEINKVIIDKEN